VLVLVGREGVLRELVWRECGLGGHGLMRGCPWRRAGRCRRGRRGRVGLRPGI
jgi:hypothetical protein